MTAPSAATRRTPRRAPSFHRLTVTAVTRLTDDAVSLTLSVPEGLRPAYGFHAGQHLALRRPTAGTDIRRTYSICSPESALPAELTVGVREIAGGDFSPHANRDLAPGDVLDVMTPAGRFGLREPRPAGQHAAVVGGSGITPVLSIAATLLARDPGARFSLIRADRSVASTMFLEEVADLKDRYPDRLQVNTVLTREDRQAGLATGRLDEARLAGLLPALTPEPAAVGSWFLCGPYGLVQSAERALRALGVGRGRIHEEIFHADTDTTAPAPTTTATPAHSTVTATLDGRRGDWPVRAGESLLDAVLRNRADAPFACKGGVCGTCRAFLVEGEVRMDRGFALEPDERAAGYVLSCQSHPVTEHVELDYDR